MTKYNFQFEQDKDCTRPCRLVVLMFPKSTLPLMHCIAMDDKCEGRLYDRPEWCPLTIEDSHVYNHDS